MSSTYPHAFEWSPNGAPTKADKEEIKKAIAAHDADILRDFAGHFGADALRRLEFEDCVTPLMYAANKDATDCMHYMIGNGADVHAVDRYGRDAAYHAAIHDSPNAIYLLKASGADLDRFNDGNPINPILAAAHNSSEKVFKALLECDAQTDVAMNNETMVSLRDLVRVSESGVLIPIFEEHLQMRQEIQRNIADQRAISAVTQASAVKVPIRKFRPR